MHEGHLRAPRLEGKEEFNFDCIIELNMKTDPLLPVLLAHFCSVPALKDPNSLNSSI